jgi:hypothetical protein
MTVLHPWKIGYPGVCSITENLPTFIQIGMGTAVSSRRLAQAVSQLGVVSGTALSMSSSSLTNQKTPTSGEGVGVTHFIPYPRVVVHRGDATAHDCTAEGRISALNIPHSSIVFDLYDTAQVTAELLRDNGVATETIKHANIVSFTCLKAISYNDRQERKDAHDLVYCLDTSRRR